MMTEVPIFATKKKEGRSSGGARRKEKGRKIKLTKREGLRNCGLHKAKKCDAGAHAGRSIGARLRISEKFRSGTVRKKKMQDRGGVDLNFKKKWACGTGKKKGCGRACREPLFENTALLHFAMSDK